ncbi:MAG: hypothetical protein CSA55_02330 [Ilumatobacter coccineus]|uniref:DUF3040 domain-containing protein n=1 Tax=Ilumatobacter coccineus TaxID=467094 RepID=A0A2G6KBM8_9ACTN|nr:MAG: hypothetical protein CSA55_02330 [Ilumatobacter coccineus]
MPLSENEKRILREIEEELGSAAFARQGYRVSPRRLVLLIVGLIGGVILTIIGLTVSYWLAFVIFVGVLVLGLLVENEVRIISRDRLGTLPVTAWLTGAMRRSGPTAPGNHEPR